MKISFFGCLLAASATAMSLSEMDTADVDATQLAQEVFDQDPSDNAILSQLEEENRLDDSSYLTLAQAQEEGAQWKGMDGSSRSGFNIPAPHCCNFYSEINFGGEMKTMCYHKEKTGNEKPKSRVIGIKVNSMDCGSSTYTVLG